MIDNQNGFSREGEKQDPVELTEQLIAIWHTYRLRNEASSFYADSSFAEWLAAENRDDGVTELDENTIQRADEIQARAAAVVAKIRRIRSSPHYLSPAIPGSPQQVAEFASNAGAAPFVELGVAAGIGRELWDEECSSWVRLPSGIPKGSYVALKVSGESMMPLLHSGDVMVLRLDSPFSSRDIVVARVEDSGFVVKRVGSVNPEFVELVSINPAFGSIRVSRAAQPVVGVVVLCWCEHQTAP
jgi:phage repressor protein C with HTH and peptisase S24 domain